MKYLMIAVAALFATECAIAQTSTTATPPTTSAAEAKAAAAREAALRNAANGRSKSVETFSGDRKKHDKTTKNDDKGVAPGSMMTADEKKAHQKKLESFKTGDECKAYMTAHSAEMQARAKAKNTTLRPPNSDPCKKFDMPPLPTKPAKPAAK